jgi:hypothetical protein
MTDRKLSPQEAKKQREEQKRQEFEKMRALFQETVPPGEKRIIEQNLEKLQPALTEDEIAPASAVVTSGGEKDKKVTGEEPGVKVGLSEPAPVQTQQTYPPVLESLTSGEPGLEIPRSEEGIFGAQGSDERERTYKELARQLRESKKRREVNGIRLHVGVTSDVFSAVSEFAFAERLDKVEILTFLLHKHLPKAPYDAVPKWMLPEGDETTVKDFALPYRQDEELENAFRHLEHRFGLYRVDVVEAILTRFLPAAKGLVRPKRRVRARLRARLGVR